MRVLLVAPKSKWDENMKNGAGFLLGQTTLAHVAALLPPDVEVEIQDEIVSPVRFDTDADLVGISVMTESAQKAYEFAREFRSRGKPVIMGGVHTFLCLEEVKEHCDAVVVGEAEGLMPGLIEDFRNGCLEGSIRYGIKSYWDILLLFDERDQDFWNGNFHFDMRARCQ